ncbi:Uncharacterised protein [BD1-7 clade bacterium]|uniref:Oxidoreductase n=1 Tax=BD1-7 clade bacterium TaxID=2029982 RepID=A0A5S9NT16_9GAMM|nr:Uncharacterised protein [BD1-7 clade bacterium]CAA0093702.1 Uncharacterised protein [BD1-7 clade bacterium]
MPKLIKNAAIAEDGYQVIEDKTIVDAAVLPEGDIIVHIDVWNAIKDSTDRQVGVWLDSDTPPHDLAETCNSLPVIAINFPAFTDGRGYSYAHTLRMQYDYTGELRAIGDVLLDQLTYMNRVGFSSYAMREDQNLDVALKHLHDFTTPYQASIDKPEPLFRQR